MNFTSPPYSHSLVSDKKKKKKDKCPLCGATIHVVRVGDANREDQRWESPGLCQFSFLPEQMTVPSQFGGAFTVREAGLREGKTPVRVLSRPRAPRAGPVVEFDLNKKSPPWIVPPARWGLLANDAALLVFGLAAAAGLLTDIHEVAVHAGPSREGRYNAEGVSRVAAATAASPQ